MQALTADVIRTVKSPHGPACTLAFLFLSFSRVQMSIYLFALRFSRRILQGGFFQVAANFKSSVSNSSIYTHWSLQGGCTPFCAQNRFNFSCHGFNFKILIHVGTFAADAAVWCMMPHDAVGSTMQIPFSTTSQSCSTAEAVWVQWIHCRVQETSSRWFCAVAKHSQEAVCVESGTHRALLAEVAVFIRNKVKQNFTLWDQREQEKKMCWCEVLLRILVISRKYFILRKMSVLGYSLQSLSVDFCGHN